MSSSRKSTPSREPLDINLDCKEYVVDYLNNAFPTRMMRVYRDEQDNARSEPMSDDEGRPVHCQEALRARDELVERLCAMPAVGSALDELLRHFGTHQVAEVTGRTKRLVFGPDGQQRLENRSGRSNIGETAAFMDGTKRIIAFSDAGGTGRSYHADKGARSARHRRIHFLLEPGWRAAEAIQGLGRSNRTNQASAPVFRPVTTNCKGQRRFISTIARRLDSLGALTRGQRQTGGQNLFDPADNLESDYAKEALNQWYHLLYAGKLSSVTLEDFVRMTGLRLVDKESGGLLEKLPPIQRWLNRLLALRIAVQDAIFDEYLALIEARVDAAREAGTLDVGVETIAADKMILLDEHVLRRDPATGAETKLTRFELHSRKRATTFARLMQIWEGTDEIQFMRNDRSGRVALRVPSYSIMEDDGSTVRMYQLVRPTGSERMRETSLYESHWRRIERDAFEAQWHAEVEEASSRIHVETINLATGLLLPVWNKLPDGSVQVWRVTDSDGNALIGRIIPAASIERLTTEFGVAMTISLSPGEIMAAARTRTGIAIPALAGARMMTVMVNGQQRFELRDYPPSRLPWFKSLGCFTEIIAYKTRLFVPTDRAEAIVARLIETREQAVAA